VGAVGGLASSLVRGGMEKKRGIWGRVSSRTSVGGKKDLGGLKLATTERRSVPPIHHRINLSAHALRKSRRKSQGKKIKQLKEIPSKSGKRPLIRNRNKCIHKKRRTMGRVSRTV